MIMTLAMVFFFAVFFATLLGKKEREPVLELPTSEAFTTATGASSSTSARG